MRKKKTIICIIVIILSILFGKDAYAKEENETKKLLYQDITINVDGSVKVKEALWVNGDYNGSNRKIEFKKRYTYPFTGIYSNFSGDTDIYDATGVSDIKVYDISQSNFKSIDDINNKENEFKLADKVNNGKYGFYTVTSSDYNKQVKIYCPSKEKKVFYLEYTINDAVVVHNDVAELYWCLLENESDEIILDYQAKVHLPNEDKNLMVWSHGPTSGSCNIIDYKTVSLTDTNINPYKFETIRVMFDKSLVPQATKNSNVNGKENIIKYENAMADSNTSLQETKKINIENQLNQEMIELEKDANIYLYNSANELIQQITWDNELKQRYQNRLYNMKEIVNQNWKESIENEYYFMTRYDDVSQSSIDSFIEKIDEGFDEEIKNQYYIKANELQNKLDEKRFQTSLRIVEIMYYVLGAICILVLLKVILEKRIYYQKYYRDFPSEDNAYIVDYLMNKKITSKTFSVTILDLIAKKIIKLEKKSDSDNDYIFILQKGDYNTSSVEKIVIDILFNVIGNDNICDLSALKDYKTTNNSYNIISYFSTFQNNIINEIKRKQYFKNSNKYANILKASTIIITIISYILGFFITKNGYINVVSYYIVITILSILYYVILSLDKGRTKKGSLEYSKWLAHKRFLKDFGRFGQKELPEIILWEKYLVTATVLGCSDNVLNQMKTNIDVYGEVDNIQRFLNDYINYMAIEQLDNRIDYFMKKAKRDSYISNSSSSSKNYNSSSSGFGGGSSSGGTGGGGGGWSRF